MLFELFMCVKDNEVEVIIIDFVSDVDEPHSIVYSYIYFSTFKKFMLRLYPFCTIYFFRTLNLEYKNMPFSVVNNLFT